MAVQDTGSTALVVASANGHTEVVESLLASGADVNQDRTVSMIWLSGRGEDDRISVCLR